MEEITAHYDKIDPFIDRVSFEHIDPRVEKVPRAFSQLISGTPEMHIGNMKELHIAKFIIAATRRGIGNRQRID